MDIFDMNLILASFGGGIFGAALGIIGGFSLCGLLVLIGVAASFSGNFDILNQLAFGPFFGPHISFAAAVAATAYAGRRGLLDAGKDVLTPLTKLKRFDVMLIGGIFGVFGYFCQALLATTGIYTDTIALTVVISNIIARLVFGKSGLLGRTPKEIKLLPDAKTLPFTLLTGFAVGLASSFATQITGALAIGYGISAISLLYLYIDEFPVTHHVSICAAYATLATGSIIVGGLFGLLAMLIGNFIGSLFNSDADTFIDPPAMTIAFLTVFILWLL